MTFEDARTIAAGLSCEIDRHLRLGSTLDLAEVERDLSELAEADDADECSREDCRQVQADAIEADNKLSAVEENVHGLMTVKSAPEARLIFEEILFALDSDNARSNGSARRSAEYNAGCIWSTLRSLFSAGH